MLSIQLAFFSDDVFSLYDTWMYIKLWHGIRIVFQTLTVVWEQHFKYFLIGYRFFIDSGVSIN